MHLGEVAGLVLLVKRLDQDAAGDKLGTASLQLLGVLTDLGLDPLDLAMLPFRMADLRLTTATRVLEATSPFGTPRPKSKEQPWNGRRGPRLSSGRF